MNDIPLMYDKGMLAKLLCGKCGFEGEPHVRILSPQDANTLQLACSRCDAYWHMDTKDKTY